MFFRIYEEVVILASRRSVKYLQDFEYGNYHQNFAFFIKEQKGLRAETWDHFFPSPAHPPTERKTADGRVCEQRRRDRLRPGSAFVLLVGSRSMNRGRHSEIGMLEQLALVDLCRGVRLGEN